MSNHLVKNKICLPLYNWYFCIFKMFEKYGLIYLRY